MTTYNSNDKQYYTRYASWEGYINSQNIFGDEIQKLFEITYHQRKGIFQIYNKIDSYVTRNSSYIDKSEEVLKTLEKIRTDIYSDTFLNYLEEYNTTIKTNKTIKESKAFNSIFDALKKVFLKINIDFSKRSINPESEEIKEEKEEWEGIQNKAMKEYMKACTDMLKQTKKKSIGYNKQRMGAD
jgi:hypothetical protein